MTIGADLAAARDAAEYAQRARTIEEARRVFGVSPELAAFVPEGESNRATIWAQIGKLHKLSTIGPATGRRRT